MPHMCLAGGYQQGRAALIDGWLNYVGGGDYSNAQLAALADALTQAQIDHIHDTLPDILDYDEDSGRIYGPDTTTLEPTPDQWLHELMTSTAEQVEQRYDDIAAKALLLAQPDDVRELAQALASVGELDDVDQVVRYKALHDAAQRLLPAARAAAAYRATRTATYEQVGDATGLGVNGVNRLISAHNANRA